MEVTIHKVQIDHTKITEVAHQNVKTNKSSTTHFRNNHRSPGIDTNDILTKQLFHIHCMSSDDDSDTESTLTINMLRIK